MATATEIANIALGYIRDNVQVSDVWADATPKAQTLRLSFPVVAARIAQAYSWPEYIVEEELTKTIVQPDSGTYYAYPAAAFAVHRVLAGSPTPTARYQRVFDLRKPLPDALHDVFALALAYQIAPSLARDNNLQLQLGQDYQRALAEARVFYAQQDNTDRTWDGSPNELTFWLMSTGDGERLIHVPPQRNYAGFDDFADGVDFGGDFGGYDG